MDDIWRRINPSLSWISSRYHKIVKIKYIGKVSQSLDCITALLVNDPLLCTMQKYSTSRTRPLLSNKNSQIVKLDPL